jgi:hypothetical protein
MKLYRIQVLGPHPARYRGLIADSDAKAIIKAQDRHVAAGFPLLGHTFQVTDSYLVVFSSAHQLPADTQHELHVDDSHLAEIEMALLERIDLLEQKVAGAKERVSPVLPAYQQHLRKSKDALALVMAV